MSNFTVQIDATRLFYREFLVQPTSLGWIDASTVQSIALAAGTYSIQVQSGVYTDFSFTVTAQGTIDFSTAFDGFAAGRGSALLTLAGLEVTLDASELAHGSGGGVLFASIPFGSDPWMLVRTLRLLPQQHYMVQQGSGVVCNLEFALGTDGRFAYAPALDVAQGGCLAGAGTPALRFHGLPVVVDVSAVSALLGLPDIAGLEPVRTGLQTLRVLPADFFRVQIDQGITGSLFSLDVHGGVSLAASPDGMRLALDAPAGVPRVRALPLALPAPGPLGFATDDFGTFSIVVGSDATGAQTVSMVMRDGRVAWLVDRRGFPGQATLGVQRRTLGPRRAFVLSVTLAGARFPGTDVAADFALTVSRFTTPDGIEIDVELGWAFGNGQFSSDAGFDGTASATLPVAGRVCGFGADQHLDLVATAPVELRFRPGWLSLAAPKLAELAGPAGALGMASLELALLAPTDRVLFAADVAPPLRSRITLTATTPWQVAFPTLHTPVGELGAVADLFDSALAEVGENLDGRRRQALRFASTSNATAFTLTLGGGLVDAAGRPIMVALAGCVCKFVFDSVPSRAELHADASTASMWLPVRGIGIRLGARTLEPLVSNFGMAFDGSVVTLLACDLPYSAVAAAPADAVAEAAAVRGLLSIVPAAVRPDAATQRNWLATRRLPGRGCRVAARRRAGGAAQRRPAHAAPRCRRHGPGRGTRAAGAARAGGGRPRWHPDRGLRPAAPRRAEFRRRLRATAGREPSGRTLAAGLRHPGGARGHRARREPVRLVGLRAAPEPAAHRRSAVDAADGGRDAIPAVAVASTGKRLDADGTDTAHAGNAARAAGHHAPRPAPQWSARAFRRRARQRRHARGAPPARGRLAR